MTLMNNGDGTFQPEVYYLTGDQPISIFSIDLDGDRDYDLTTANYSSDNISIFLNQTGPYFICGDVDGSGEIDILDVVYIIDYKYKEGPEPLCLPINSCADVDNDGDVTMLDVVYIIEYRYKEGPDPDCP